MILTNYNHHIQVNYRIHSRIVFLLYIFCIEFPRIQWYKIQLEASYVVRVNVLSTLFGEYETNGYMVESVYICFLILPSYDGNTLVCGCRACSLRDIHIQICLENTEEFFPHTTHIVLRRFKRYFCVGHLQT